MTAGDALLYQAGGGNPFGGSGLVIVRRSTIPAHLVEQMETGFRDQKALQEASDATGIRERVEASIKNKSGFGPAFFALSPEWMFKDRGHDPWHPVIYWLNLYDQQSNNYGWFTVEQLDLCIEGKGPIPKSPVPSPPLSVETENECQSDPGDRRSRQATAAHRELANAHSQRRAGLVRLPTRGMAISPHWRALVRCALWHGRNAAGEALPRDLS